MKNLETNNKKLSMRSKVYVMSVLVLLLSALTSCSNSSSMKNTTLNIYQPSTITLPAGNAIQTKEGQYTPQTEEIWHSDKRYRDLERKLYYTQ